MKLAADSVPEVRAWAARLNSELTEVRKLLKAEGVSVESVFLEESNEGAFLIYYMRAEDFNRARELSRASQHPIDIFHQQVMKMVSVSWTKLECLLDATAD